MLRLFVACSHGCGSCAVSYFAKDDDMVCGGTFISVLCFYIYIKKKLCEVCFAISNKILPGLSVSVLV